MHHRNNRGQISFEMLLLTAIILTTSIWVSTYYLTVKDSTLAMQLTKVHMLNEIDEAGSPYTLEKISFEETSSTEITIDIKTCPQYLPSTPTFRQRLSELKDNIEANTKYSNVTLRQISGNC